MNNLKLLLILLCVALMISGCNSKQAVVVSETQENPVEEQGSEEETVEEPEVTEETVNDAPELPVCGDGICDETELNVCEEDCPSCDDSDECTADSFDLASLSCKNIKTKNCCGDGICEPDEECERDCPVKRTTLASYPYPFVHGDDLVADIVVGEGCTAVEVIAATDIALGLGIDGPVPGIMESDITTIRNKNTMLLGNPCTNGFIAELIPYENDCLEDYEEGEGRMSLFVTGEFGGKETYSLVISGYSAVDIKRAAQILRDYERNMAKLKGMSIKV